MKFLALLLCAAAVVHVLPASFDFYYRWESSEPRFIPRWSYLQFFVAALHLVYALFLFQIPDWSSLRSVSIALLFLAFLFGLISTALLIEGGHGSVTNFLALPHLTVRNATLWSVAMLCLATLLSYLCGREAANWRRAERLMVEIFGKRT